MTCRQPVVIPSEGCPQQAAGVLLFGSLCPPHAGCPPRQRLRLWHLRLCLCLCLCAALHALACKAVRWHARDCLPACPARRHCSLHRLQQRTDYLQPAPAAPMLDCPWRSYVVRADVRAAVAADQAVPDSNKVSRGHDCCAWSGSSPTPCPLRAEHAADSPRIDRHSVGNSRASMHTELLRHNC